MRSINNFEKAKRSYLTSIRIFWLLFALFYGQISLSQTHDSIKLIKIDSVVGDLDNDNIDELVVVYDSNLEAELGNVRFLHIYKKNTDKAYKNNPEWLLLKSSNKAIYPSESGGMMGSGYENMEIINGILTIHHFGGSRDKWSKTHKYRYQNDDFYLIGFSSSYMNLPSYESVDYNLSTGKIIFEKEIDEYDESGEPTGKVIKHYDTLLHKIDLPRIDNITLGTQKIYSDKTGITVYLF